jgi:hypothetical protein|tara:strand:+ start:244 stop:477 length:234 start_codon:yes stop_codon:yes gene_type:complete
MNDIIVEYSGWVRMSPKNIRFEYIGQDDMPQNIDGVQWQALSEDEQDDYILEDAIAAIRDADDGEWEDISVEVHQPV